MERRSQTCRKGTRCQNKELVRRFFEEMCNGRKLEVADELFADGHVYHDPASPFVGPGPDAHWDVHETMESGDTVITR